MNERDDFLDNAKGMLIILVFFGHSLEFIGGWENEFLRFILTAIYLVHMPAFCFLAGITTSEKKAKDRAINLFALFLIFQIVYAPVVWFAGWPLGDVFIKPIYTLWFLLSLSVWTFFLPMFMRVKNQILIFLAISLLSGGLFFVGYTLGVSRTVYFLVFFLVGNIYGKSIIAAVKQRADIKMKLFAVLIMACFTSFIYSLDIKNTVLYGVSSYAKLGYGFLEGVGLRATIYLISAMLVFALLVVVTKGNNVLTRIGRNSLSIFLFHPVLLLLFLGELLQKLNQQVGEVVSVFVIAALTFFVSLILSRDGLTYFLSNSAVYVANRFKQGVG